MPAMGSKIEIDKPRRSATRRWQLPSSMNDRHCADAATPRRAAPRTRLSQQLRSPRTTMNLILGGRSPSRQRGVAPRARMNRCSGSVPGRTHTDERRTMDQYAQPRHPEYQYLDILREILDHGDKRMDRTGVGTLALFGRHMRYDVSKTFPVLTTRKIYWKTAIKEMLWMLSGSTNIRDLLKQGVHIWTDWPLAKYRQETGEKISQAEFEARILDDEAFAERHASIGKSYSSQWRSWWCPRRKKGIDQIQIVVDQIKSNPASRRILWEGWNVAELDLMALPPCHKTYQVFVSSDGKLSLALCQRSADSCIGLPSNQIGLGLLVHMLAKETDLEPGEAIWYGMDVHMYLNHIEQAKEQLSRAPKPWPRLRIKRKAPSLFDYTIDDFELEGYDPHPPIKLPIAV